MHERHACVDWGALPIHVTLGRTFWLPPACHPVQAWLEIEVRTSTRDKRISLDTASLCNLFVSVCNAADNWYVGTVP